MRSFYPRVIIAIGVLPTDLIFDIEGKDLHLPCKTTHSYAICTRCGMTTIGKSGLCKYCKSGSLNYTSILCDKCISTLKKEVRHLTDLLINDLRVDEKSISMFFSGNNGFHIVESDESFRAITSEARSNFEIS